MRLEIYSEDFIKIQKTIKKIKLDPTRYYLHQAKVKYLKDSKISVQFTDTHIAINTIFDCLVDANSVIEDNFEINISFDSFKNIIVSKNGLVSLAKKDKSYFFEHEGQRTLCTQIDGTLPNIEHATKVEYKEPREICLDLKKLNKFENLVKDAVLVIGDSNNLVTIKTVNGKKIGAIMPITY